jgi:lysophospholipase L1-like esterase
MKKIYCILLLVFLFLVSAYGQVTKVTYRSFDHYNDKVENFRKEKRIDSTEIVMLGNSLTEYAGSWSKLLGIESVVNRGIAGDDADGIYNRLDQILPGHPKAIFLMVGIDDLSQNLNSENVAEHVEKLIMRIRHESPNTKLYVQSILPINESFGSWKIQGTKAEEIYALNNLLRRYSVRHKIEFINLYPNFVRHGTNVMRKELTLDGLHLSAFGYKIWAYELRKYMK